MPASSSHPEDKLVRAVLLLDMYGELLTDRQREFMQLHFEQDLSFSEIARDYGISRQAVHDSVKHAMASLERFEEVLHMVERGRSTAGEDHEPHIGGRQLVERLCELRDRVRARQTIDDPAWVARELDGLIVQLGGAEPVETSAAM